MFKGNIRNVYFIEGTDEVPSAIDLWIPEQPVYYNCSHVGSQCAR